MFYFRWFSKHAITAGILMISVLFDAGVSWGDINMDFLIDCNKQDLAAAQRDLDQGADVNSRDQDAVFGTALTWAANRHRDNVVDFLLSHGAEVNLPGNDGQFPLELVFATNIATPDYSLLKRLLQAGANVNQQDKSGTTALMEAASSNNGWGVKHLLRAGADPNMTDNTGHTAAQLALRSNHPDIASLIKNWSSGEGFLYAVEHNDLEGVQNALSSGADPGRYYRLSDGSMTTPLYEAIIHTDSEEVVEVLLSKGADFNTRVNGYFPLYQAASLGETQVVQDLLNHGANPSVRSDNGKTPLDKAKDNGHDDIVRLLRSSTGP